MAKAKNVFIKSKMNKDLDDRLLPPGEYRDAQNVSISRSEGEDVGADLWDAVANAKEIKPVIPDTLGRFKVIGGVDARTRKYKKTFQLVETLMPENAQILLGGQKGSNKSTFAMQWGMSIACDMPSFLDFKINGKGKSVLFIDTEIGENLLLERREMMIENFVDWNEDLILVEGVFDAIVAGNAVPILGSTLRTNSRLIRKIVFNDTPVYMALDPDVAAKERKIIETLLRYDVELYKIDVSGYEDVGAMPGEVFLERKKNAAFIDRDNYLLLNLLSAV